MCVDKKRMLNYAIYVESEIHSQYNAHKVMKVKGYFSKYPFRLLFNDNDYQMEVG